MAKAWIPIAIVIVGEIVKTLLRCLDDEEDSEADQPDNEEHLEP